MNRFTSLTTRLGAVAHADVIRSYLGLRDFEAISGFRQDRFSRESLGLKEVPFFACALQQALFTAPT